jgi:uncharacterized glyoxalase superfamily protein PhnB
MRLSQINLVVTDMNAALAFYRRLGVELQVTPDGKHAASARGESILLELDTTTFVPEWDAGWNGESSGGGVVIGFELSSRTDVDDLYAELTSAGHSGHQPPYDAFWGARYAIVDDPDGHAVGLMSPIEDQRKFWPPTPPPSHS